MAEGGVAHWILRVRTAHSPFVIAALIDDRLAVGSAPPTASMPATNNSRAGMFSLEAKAPPAAGALAASTTLRPSTFAREDWNQRITHLHGENFRQVGSHRFLDWSFQRHLQLSDKANPDDFSNESARSSKTPCASMHRP